MRPAPTAGSHLIRILPETKRCSRLCRLQHRQLPLTVQRMRTVRLSSRNRTVAVLTLPGVRPRQDATTCLITDHIQHRRLLQNEHDILLLQKTVGITIQRFAGLILRPVSDTVNHEKRIIGHNRCLCTICHRQRISNALSGILRIGIIFLIDHHIPQIAGQRLRLRKPDGHIRRYQPHRSRCELRRLQIFERLRADCCFQWTPACFQSVNGTADTTRQQDTDCHDDDRFFLNLFHNAPSPPFVSILILS